MMNRFSSEKRSLKLSLVCSNRDRPVAALATRSSDPEVPIQNWYPELVSRTGIHRKFVYEAMKKKIESLRRIANVSFIGIWNFDERRQSKQREGRKIYGPGYHQALFQQSKLLVCLLAVSAASVGVLFLAVLLGQ